MVMIITGISMGIFLIALGLLIHLGKKYDLIAGYNTMDEWKKEAFNIEKFALHFGITFYIMGGAIIIISLLLSWLSIAEGYFVGSITFIILGGVGYLNIIGQIIKRHPKI